jgi:hypothetical protein
VKLEVGTVAGVDSHGDDKVVEKAMGYFNGLSGMEIIKRKKGL